MRVVVSVYGRAIGPKYIDAPCVKCQPLTTAAGGTGSDVICPFCQETDFDLIGLRSHLERWCEKYQETPTL